jgi:hypothetical protein
MGKAAAQDLINAGFRAEQFGMPADFSAYVTAIVTDASTWASAAVGTTTYANATGLPLLNLKRAEIAFTKAELWRRRAAFIDANAESAMETANTAYLNRREYLAQAAAADDEAQRYLDLVLSNGDATALGGGVAMGYAESGPFAVTPQ